MKFKLHLLFIITLFNATNAFSQDIFPFRLHGTIIVAAIGADGIVMASDSRMVMKDENDSIYAYIDGVQKLFPLTKYVFALAGDPIINNTHFEKILLTLDSNINSITSPRDLIDNFLRQYASISDSILEMALKNKIYVAGYYNGFKINYEYKRKNIRVDSFYLSNYSFFIDSLNLWEYSYKLPVKELTNMVKKVLQDVISISGQIDIGGPISILTIDRYNNVNWVTKDNVLPILTKCQLANYIKHNQIKVQFIDKSKEAGFYKEMNTVYEKCN